MVQRLPPERVVLEFGDLPVAVGAEPCVADLVVQLEDGAVLYISRVPLLLYKCRGGLGGCVGTAAGGRELREGHQTRSPMMWRLAGTRTVRTRRVSTRTPMTTAVPTSATRTEGSTARTTKVPAIRSPAAVMTPPVTESPRVVPSLMPSCRD